MGNLLVKIREMIEEIKVLSEQERIESINAIKVMLHEISPMKEEPVDCILWIEAERVHANNYNPNAVAPPEMELLRLSIEEDGFTQPIVCFPEDGGCTVVDGFHRNRVGRECGDIRDRIRGYLPVVMIKPERESIDARMASTIRHNRARGKHKIQSMSEIVVELSRRNWSDEKIAKQLGMDADEVLRLKQVSGLADLFGDFEFSEAWEPEEQNV